MFNETKINSLIKHFKSQLTLNIHWNTEALSYFIPHLLDEQMADPL